MKLPYWRNASIFEYRKSHWGLQNWSHCKVGKCEPFLQTCKLWTVQTANALSHVHGWQSQKHWCAHCSTTMSLVFRQFGCPHLDVLQRLYCVFLQPKSHTSADAMTEHGKQFFQRKSVEAHSDYQLVTCRVKDNLHCRQNHGEFRDLRARLEAKADLKRRQRKVCSRNLQFLYGL